MTGSKTIPEKLPTRTALAMIAVMLATLVAIGGEPPPRDTPKGETISVTAKVGYGQGGSGYFPPAVLEPVEFEVPEGYQAGNLFYHWADPKTGEKRDKLGAKNIYSISQGRYMTEVKDNPGATLPAGRYRFVVGGLPGAIGNLTYTTVRSTKTDKSGDVVQGTPKKPPVKQSGDKNTNTGEPPGSGVEEVLLNLPKDFDVFLPEIDFSRTTIQGFPGSTKGTSDGPLVLRFRDGKVSADQQWTAYVKQQVENPHIVEWRFRLKMEGVLRRGVITGTMTYYYEGGIRAIRYPEWQNWEQGELKGQADADGKTTLRCPAKIVKSLVYNFESKSMVTNPAMTGGGDFSFTMRLPKGELQSSQKLSKPSQVSEIPKPN